MAHAQKEGLVLCLARTVLYISYSCAYTREGIEKGRQRSRNRMGGGQKEQKVIVRSNHERVTAFCLKSVTKCSGFFNLERNRRKKAEGGRK